MLLLSVLYLKDLYKKWKKVTFKYLNYVYKKK